MSFLCALAAVGCTGQNEISMKEAKVKEMDLSGYKDSKPERTMRLIFIHHSVGGQWLADNGERKDILPDSSLYLYHPNGGGLRALLKANNYEVHEAGYKSAIGDKTDVCNWNEKFRDQMGEILRCDQQDTPYQDSATHNDIVMFKSCFPTSEIESEGKIPGDPDSCVKTLANYMATYTKILEYFKKQPKTLFVVVTAPPVVEKVPNRAKEFIKNLIGWQSSIKATGERIRRFNNWLKDSQNGWLAGYQGKNVVVFDYYDVLTGHGKSNFLIYPSMGGTDSHPSAEGNAIAGREFVVFLNKAVNRHSKTNQNIN